jgi:hypothetical protein
VRAASSTLSGGWVGDFERAASQLDASEAEASSAQAILEGISSLKSVTGSGDAKGSKKQFVATLLLLPVSRKLKLAKPSLILVIQKPCHK